MGEKDIIKYRFQKGVSGNPAGRSPGSKNRKSIIEWALNSEVSNSKDFLDCWGFNPKGEKEKFTVEELIIYRQISEAIRGNLKAAEWLLNGKYGKVGQEPAEEAPGFEYNEIQVAYINGGWKKIEEIPEAKIKEITARALDLQQESSSKEKD